MTPLWACPLCYMPLSDDGGMLVCPNHHSYDIAREGYVNLIATGRKLGEAVGDSSDMLIARRAFLAAGNYEPLRRRLVELVRGARHEVVGDIGCGEGWYIGGMAADLPDAACFGTDIARFGVRMAARSYPGVRFAAADTYARLPLADQGADVLVNVFAPRNPAEFNRVLATTGRLIVVIPAPGHLLGLRRRELLLGIQPDKDEAVARSLQADFVLAASDPLDIPLHLDGDDVRNLIAMTPNARRNLIRDKAYQPLSDTASFRILTFERLA